MLCDLNQYKNDFFNYFNHLKIKNYIIIVKNVKEFVMKRSVIFIIFILSTMILFSQDKTVYLTSLEWPPYSSQTLDEQGASIVVAKAAFLTMGYDLQVDFYPWMRAVDYGKKHKKYIGYFPEYHAKSIEKEFIFSDEIGKSPLGFVENKNKSIKWKTLKDLSKYKIGTVSGYVNTLEFDTMVANKQLTVDAVVDDITNIKKVIKSRIDLAVIDRYVLQYLLLNDDSVKKDANKVQFNSKLMENKKLYICFRKNRAGKKLNKIFNQGLRKIDVDKIMNDYFKEVLKN